MNREKKYRNEWKYVCCEADITGIGQRLDGIMAHDSHGDNGKYVIHSLYFDDYADNCARDTEAGVSKRYKYRIRYYNNNPEFIQLERKEKLDGRCYKKSCKLTPSDYSCILNKDYEQLLFYTDKPVLREFGVSAMRRLFEPKVIIDYERTAYVEPITNVRITLDRNISASREVNSFLDGDYLRVPVLPEGQHVLEVKFDYILPSSIRSVITRKELIQTSFSKYYLGRKII